MIRLSEIDNLPAGIHWHYQSVGEVNVTPWQASIIEEVASFSRYLLAHPLARKHSEIIALGFWFRHANIVHVSSHYHAASDAVNGKVFHIAPANVDTVFFYSLLISVLAGNQNVVRISGRSGDIARTLISILLDYVSDNPEGNLPNAINLVEYEASNEEATRFFSQWADFRVLWGGDRSIEAIEAIAPHNRQIVFPDRYSMACLRLTDSTQAEAAARALLTDTMPFAQQACSSPKALVWLDTPLDVQRSFYAALTDLSGEQASTFTMRDAVEQQLDLQRMVIATPVVPLERIKVAKMTVLEVEGVFPELFDFHSGHGLLLSHKISAIENLPVADKLQTVAVFGLNEEQTRTLMEREGIRRVVCLGRSLEFDWVWDGIDLVNSFATRKQVVQTRIQR